MYVVSSHISFSIDSLALTFGDLVLFNPDDLMCCSGGHLACEGSRLLSGGATYQEEGFAFPV